MTRSSTFAFAVLFAACATSTPATKTTPAATPPPAAAPAAPAAPTAMLGIADLKYFEGTELGVHLSADGALEVPSAWMNKPGQGMEKVGSITADGTLTIGDGSTAKLQPDGTFKTSDGDSIGFTIEGETLVMGHNHVTLDPQGAVLLEGKPLDKPAHVEGATTPDTRRTALLLVAIALSR